MADKKSELYIEFLRFDLPFDQIANHEEKFFNAYRPNSNEMNELLLYFFQTFRKENVYAEMNNLEYDTNLRELPHSVFLSIIGLDMIKAGAVGDYNDIVYFNDYFDQILEACKKNNNLKKPVFILSLCLDCYPELSKKNSKILAVINNHPDTMFKTAFPHLLKQRQTFSCNAGNPNLVEILNQRIAELEKENIYLFHIQLPITPRMPIRGAFIDALLKLPSNKDELQRWTKTAKRFAGKQKVSSTDNDSEEEKNRRFTLNEETIKQRFTSKK
jgi:hypothetical protein